MSELPLRLVKQEEVGDDALFELVHRGVPTAKARISSSATNLKDLVAPVQKRSDSAQLLLSRWARDRLDLLLPF